MFLVTGDDVCVDGLTFIGGGTTYGIIISGNRDVVRGCSFSGSCTLWTLAQNSSMTIVSGNSINGSDSFDSSTPVTFAGVQGYVCTGNVFVDTQGFGIQSVCAASTSPILDGSGRTSCGVVNSNNFFQPQYAETAISSAGQTEFSFSLTRPVARYGIQVEGTVAPTTSYTISTSDNQNFTATFATPPPEDSAISLIGFRSLECIQVNSWAYDISIVGNIIYGTGDSGIVVGFDYHNGVLDPSNTQPSDFPGRITVSANTVRGAAYAGIAINNITQASTVTGNNISDCGILADTGEFSTGMRTGYPSSSITSNCFTNTTSPIMMQSGLSLLAPTLDDGSADKALKLAGNAFSGTFNSKISLVNGGPDINQSVTIGDGMITMYPETPDLDSSWANVPSDTPYFTYAYNFSGWTRDTTNILGGIASLQTTAGSYVAVTPTASAIMQDCILKLDFWAITQRGESFVEIWTNFNGNFTLITRLLITATAWQQYTMTAAMEQFVIATGTQIRIGANSGTANVQYITLSMIRIPDQS